MTTQVALVHSSSTLQVLEGTKTTYDLAMDAIRLGTSLEDLANKRATGNKVSYDDLVADSRLLPPLLHPDPAHCIVSGTGLDHVGSAMARDAMHSAKDSDPSKMSDSMRMFRMGLEGGKPVAGKPGAQPEWFYKGDGDSIVSPGQSLELPSFAQDGGEEAEIVALYVISESGEPHRVGFALGNEYSDHVLEKQNYLYLAHSKLRQCSIGPELLIGSLPESVSGTVSVERGGKSIWSSEFLTGEANMTHSIANLEYHHFKYRRFRRPGDIHCHFLGASVLSFSSGTKARPGDTFEISSPQFGRPLRNTLERGSEEYPPAGTRSL